MNSNTFTWLDPKTKFKFEGRSRAADATSIFCTQLEANLDAGQNFQPIGAKYDAVFVTHSHSDHCFGLTHFVSRRRQPQFFVPQQSVDLVEKYLVASQELSSHERVSEGFEYETNHRTVGVTPGQQFTYKQRYLVTVWPMTHSVPCVGYSFSEQRQKLKEEYKGIPSKEIGQLRKTGVEVSELVSIPLFAFLGDTSIEALVTNPDLLNFPTLFVECTYLGEEDLAEAGKRQHIAWLELVPHIQSHPDTTFVLTHFSHRYSVPQILQFFQQQAEKGITNVVPFIC